jgi:hypothetical protein
MTKRRIERKIRSVLASEHLKIEVIGWAGSHIILAFPHENVCVHADELLEALGCKGTLS